MRGRVHLCQPKALGDDLHEAFLIRSTQRKVSTWQLGGFGGMDLGEAAGDYDSGLRTGPRTAAHPLTRLARCYVCHSAGVDYAQVSIGWGLDDVMAHLCQLAGPALHFTLIQFAAQSGQIYSHCTPSALFGRFHVAAIMPVSSNS
jgi:hypothetical protein